MIPTQVFHLENQPILNVWSFKCSPPAFLCWKENVSPSYSIVSPRLRLSIAMISAFEKEESCLFEEKSLFALSSSSSSCSSFVWASLGELDGLWLVSLPMLPFGVFRLDMQVFPCELLPKELPLCFTDLGNSRSFIEFSLCFADPLGLPVCWNARRIAGDRWKWAPSCVITDRELEELLTVTYAVFALGIGRPRWSLMFLCSFERQHLHSVSLKAFLYFFDIRLYNIGLTVELTK